MIQRIQTVYLLVAAILVICCMSMPVGHFHQEGIQVADFYNLWLKNTEGVRDFSAWALFTLLLFGAVLPLVAVFMFKRRMVQVRLTMFGGLLLIGYYIVLGVFVYIFKSRYNADFTIHWSVAFPAVSLILEYLAFRAIMADEMIVRSLDRLR